MMPILKLLQPKEEVKEYVFLNKDGRALMQEVKTGVQDNTYIEITKGIEEGQEVITGPLPRDLQKTEK